MHDHDDDHRTAQRFADLLELTEILGSEAGFDERMDALCAWGARLIDCDRVSIFRRDGDRLRGAFNFGNPPQLLDTFPRFSVALDDPLIARTFSTGGQITVNDTLNDPMFDGRIATAAGIRAVVLAPIWDPERRPGGFVTAEYNERPRTFTWTQAQMLAGVAKLAEGQLNANALTVAHSEALRASESLHERLQDLERSESLGRLAGSLAHDFNNVLAVISGNAELLGRHVADGNRPMLEAIMRASGHAADLIAQLLRYARGSADLASTFDLSTVLAELRNLVESSVGDPVTLELDLTLGCHVRMERTQAEQVVMNLALNARDAMPRGGTLRISCHAEHTDDDTARRLDIHPGRYAHLAVTDTGRGIPDDLLPDIFTPFVTSRADGRHVGLGLATVFRIVTSAGGAVAARNGTDGAVVDVYLPIAAEPDDPDAGAADDEEPVGTERLLIVDDNAPLLAVLSRQLVQLGYDTVTAGSAEEALLMAAGAGRFDLVVSDVLMPGIGGPDLARRWRQIVPGQRFLFMTAFTGNPVAGDRLLTPDVVLEKPFTSSEFARRVRRALDTSRSRSMS